MQKRNILLSICALFLIVFFSACESEGEGKKASMSGEVDGQALTFQDLAARLYNDLTFHGSYRSLNINGTINGQDLLISVIAWDTNGHPENGVLVQKYYTSENAFCYEDEHGVKKCDSGGVRFTIVGKSALDVYDSEMVVGYDGYVEITSFDFNTKKVSGKFHAKVSNWDGDSKIVEGEFEGLPYVILD